MCDDGGGGVNTRRETEVKRRSTASAIHLCMWALPRSRVDPFHQVFRVGCTPLLSQNGVGGRQLRGPTTSSGV